MSFQTCKTSVHLRNKNEDIFDEIRETLQMDYFNNVLATFLDLDRGIALAVYGGSESSRI